MKKILCAALAWCACVLPAGAQQLALYGVTSGPSLSASFVISAKPRALYALAVNVGATAGWVILYDAATVPANGTVPTTYRWSIPVTSNGTSGYAFAAWPVGLQFTTGIAAVFSSTDPRLGTQTSSTTASFSAQIQ